MHCIQCSLVLGVSDTNRSAQNLIGELGPDYKKILRLSYDVIITYDNRKSNLR